MRKVSKNRADDDINSSTNGSVTNEVEEQLENDDPPAALADDDQPDADESPVDRKENGKKGDDDGDDYEPTPSKKSKSKKKGAKSKATKRKSGRVAEAEAKADNDDDDDDDEEEEEEYEVDKVVGSKKIKGKLHYLIRWKGYSADSDTWEPENTLSCPELISKFKEQDEGSNKSMNSSKIKISLKKKGRPSKAKKGVKPSPAKKSKKSEDWDSENADENAEYEVERILEVHHKKNGSREFLIHWKGWSTKFDSWEPEEHLNCSDLIKKFMSKVESARSVGSKELRVAPEKAKRFTLAQRSTGRRLSKRRGQSQRVRYDDAE